MENPNRLIAGMGEPFFKIFKDNLCLLLDKSGVVLEIFGRDDAAYSDVVDYLDRNPDVFRVFEFGRSRNLKEAAERPGLIPIKRNIPDLEPGREFYTDLPLVLLKIAALSDRRFLGVIKVPEFLPHMPFSASNLIFFQDQEGRLRGVNRNFLNAVDLGTIQDPLSILGRGIGEFVSPTPLEFQERSLNEALKHRDLHWSFAGGLTDIPAEELSRSGIESGTVPQGSLRWENDGNLLRYLMLPGSFDTAAQDFRLSVKLKILRGQCPILIAGNPPTETRAPDFHGYMAGEQVGRNGYLLKKKGMTILVNALKPHRGELFCRFSKIGRALFLEINNEQILGFHDPHFIRNANTRLFLGLRKGHSAEIMDLRLETRKSADRIKPGADEEVVVRLKTAPGRTFTLTLFPNGYLTSKYPHISCHLLSDVTHFQEKADGYRRQYREAARKGAALESQLKRYHAASDPFIGSSKAIEVLRQKAGLIAGAVAPVLVQGPTGTGKEVLARYIHEQGPRRGEPFVKVDCSTLPATLIESELFGYEKGAFTGAAGSRAGRFEQAEGGTLFLDEIGNLSLAFQAKLLGALQDFTVTRLGGSRAIKLDVRLVAASNIDVGTLVKQGSFREDLYYRINTIQLELPPLRERPEDIESLSRHFLEAQNAGGSKIVNGLAPAAFRKLLEYEWPGNVRELRNVIHRAHIFCEGEVISEDDIELPKKLTPHPAAGAAVKTSYHLRGLTRERLVELLEKHHGRVTGVARELGISRKACYDNFAKFGIDHTTYRSVI